MQKKTRPIAKMGRVNRLLEQKLNLEKKGSSKKKEPKPP
jgi:hypothetical protein